MLFQIRNRIITQTLYNAVAYLSPMHWVLGGSPDKEFKRMERQMPIWTSFVAVLCMATFSTARDAANRGTDRNPENLATRCIERINNLSQTASTNSNGLCERSIKGI